jgi:hypothetical protein
MELKTLFKRENAADPLSIRIGKNTVVFIFIQSGASSVPRN